jgi:hypothetical protein
MLVGVADFLRTAPLLRDIELIFDWLLSRL